MSWRINLHASKIYKKPQIVRNINPLSANPTKWSKTLKQFVGNSRRIERV